MQVYTGIWLLKCLFTRYCRPELRSFRRQILFTNEEFAGRSSASSSDSECSMLYLIDYVSVDCSAHCRSCKHAENCSMRRGSSSETSYTIRALSGYTIPFFTAQNTAMSGFSRDTRWLFNVRDKFVVVVETNTTARSVVSKQFFNDGLPTQHWTAASGELSNPGRG